MKKLTLVTLLGLASLANAQSSFQLVEGGFELTLADVTLPNSTAGTMIVQECASCDRQSLLVNASTVYRLPTGDVSLADFRAAVNELMLTVDGRETYVSVFYNLQTRRVTRVSLHPDAS